MVLQPFVLYFALSWFSLLDLIDLQYLFLLQLESEQDLGI